MFEHASEELRVKSECALVHSESGGALAGEQDYVPVAVPGRGVQQYVTSYHDRDDSWALTQLADDGVRLGELARQKNRMVRPAGKPCVSMDWT